MKGLTPKQERFCLEYMVDLNASEAARRAGYAAKDADVQGPRLLGNVGIRARIDGLKAEASKKLGLTIERVLEELQLIAFQDVQTFVDVDPETGAVKMKALRDWPPNAGRIIKKIKERRVFRESSDGSQTIIDCTLEVEPWNKNDALSQLRDHLKPLANTPPEQKIQIEIVNATPAGRVKKNV